MPLLAQRSNVKYVALGSSVPEDAAAGRRSSSLNSDTDPELEGLTLYEKKALLVNRELDRQGMGRYQWMIFGLCGFGYFLDLLWAQAFGLVIIPMQHEFGFSDTEYGNIFTSFNAGLCAGAFVWGVLVDIIGRYWAFNCTVLISSVFGLCIGIPDNYNAVLVLAACIGIGVGGNIPIDTTITLECLPQNRRWLLPALSIFQPLGVVVCSSMAYGFIPNHSCVVETPCSQVADGEPCCTKSSNYGWRYLLFTLGGVTMTIFFLRFVVFKFKESAKYLLYKGRDAEAVKVLQYIASYNKHDCLVTLETFAALTDDRSSTSTDQSARPILGPSDRPVSEALKDKFREELLRYRLLFANSTIARLTILLWITYAFDYWGFTIVGSLLPTILSRKGRELNQSVRETYLSYVYIYIWGVPAAVIGAFLSRWLWLSLLLSSLLFGSFLFVFTVVDTTLLYIVVSAFSYGFQTIFNAILYGSSPLLFPAQIRGTACGIASFWGRLFAIVAPLAAGPVLARSTDGVLYLAGSGVFISTIAIAFMPRKYLEAQDH